MVDTCWYKMWTEALHLHCRLNLHIEGLLLHSFHLNLHGCDSTLIWAAMREGVDTVVEHWRQAAQGECADPYDLSVCFHETARFARIVAPRYVHINHVALGSFFDYGVNPTCRDTWPINVSHSFTNVHVEKMYREPISCSATACPLRSIHVNDVPGHFLDSKTS